MADSLAVSAESQGDATQKSTPLSDGQPATDELHKWFGRVARNELPDLPERPRLGMASGEDRLWHTVAFFLFHVIQRGTATLTFVGSAVLDRKKPNPVWREECERAIQSARWLCGMIVSERRRGADRSAIHGPGTAGR